MLAGFEITCANKNYRGIIVRIGGSGWSMDARQAIVKMGNQQLRLNICIDGSYFDVGVRGEGFDAYLALEPDGFPLHSLDGLPSC